MGFRAVEIGYSVLEIPLKDKLDAIADLHERGVNVVYEWGKKFPIAAVDVAHSAREIRTIIAAGARCIVIEGDEILRLLDTGGDESADALVDLVQQVGPEAILFEADTDPHIAWVLKYFGPGANIGPDIVA